MVTDRNWHIKPNKDKALMLAQREIAVFVYDTVKLEGIHFTLPEIQTLYHQYWYQHTANLLS